MAPYGNTEVHHFGKPAELSHVLLSAIITKGSKVTDGDTIIAILPAWQQIISMLQADPSDVHRIDARTWEEIIAGAYQKAGFDEVILTPRSGDLGRDVIAVKHGFWSIRIIDQIKAYGPEHRVSADAIRALIGVLQMDHQASKGLVTTTSTFAPRVFDDPTIKPLLGHRLELVNGKQLLERLERISAGYRLNKH